MKDEELACKVIEYRKANNLSVSQLAGRLQSSKTSLAKFEDTGEVPRDPLKSKLYALVESKPVKAEAPPPPPPLWKQLAKEHFQVEEVTIVLDHATLCGLLGLPTGEGDTEIEILNCDGKSKAVMPLKVNVKVFTGDHGSNV